MTASRPLKRIRRGAIVLASVATLAVTGHHWLTDRPWLESIHWFVITVATIGYGEKSTEPPAVQVFTIFVIIFGIAAVAYPIGGFLELWAQGEIERLMGVRRMSREIDQLTNHTVVCGFGRLGKTLTEELASRQLPFVVVEQDEAAVGEARDLGYLFVTGDATDEDVLLQAGVKQAKTLIVALRSDADNVFLTLTARNLNPRLRIIARGEQPSTEKKLLQAGADRVVMPAVLGARRMAAMVTHPHAAELIDLVTDHRALDATIEELLVEASSPWAGKSIRDAATRTLHHLLIIAMRRADGNMVFNPEADLVVHPGDTAIVMGKHEDIERFKREYVL
jgi:voltage-gated potassium channel